MITDTDPTDPASQSTEPARPPLRVVHGDATPEEIAAIVAVLAAAASGDAASPADGPRRSRWSSPATRLRVPARRGPGAWRAAGQS